MRQCFIDRGRRSSAAVSYLRPARARPNLEVVTGACVTRIVVERGTATGVEYRCGRSAVHAHASREVIVSAGTFNTPQVLMLSGIGPAAQLQAHGIRAGVVHRHRPGDDAARRALCVREIALLSDPNDMATLVKGDERACALALSGPLAPFRGRQIAPDPDVRTRAEVEAWIRRTAVTVHHPARTCRIGSGPEAVVDPSLRVHGIERLRVADASVMPDLVSAHITPAC